MNDRAFWPPGRSLGTGPIAGKFTVWRAVALMVGLLVSACGDAAQSSTLEFTGSECVADLPASIESGAHTFVLNNTSDLRSLPVYVVALARGHAYGEFASLQPAPGAYFVLPDWAEYARRDFQAADVERDNQRPFGFMLEPGEHAVYLWASHPPAIWLCDSLTVTAQP